MSKDIAYDRMVKGIAAVFITIGVIILIVTLANGGGPLSTGVLIGAAFVGIGIGRWKLQSFIAGNRE